MTGAPATIIGKLKTIGYELYFTEDKVKYQYTLPGDPPADKVRPLLEELKKHKEEALVYLKSKQRPYWQRPDRSCYACGSREAWRSEYKLTCARCHPPADIHDVVEWIRGTA